MVDEGPFQNITAIEEVSDDTPELFVDLETFWARGDCADPDTDAPLDPSQAVKRVPETGADSTLCVCTDPDYGGGYDCYSLRFNIPLTANWPAGVVGQSSGGVICDGWPPEPPGWGIDPENISTPAGRCDTPSWYTGRKSVSTYRVTMTYCSNCQGSAGAPEDCCG